MNNSYLGYNIESSYVSITNNIANFNNNSAFELTSLSNCFLQNNIVLNNKGGGFDLFSVSYTTLINNTITNNSYGINVGKSSNNSLINNTITFNGNGGIFLYQQSINNTLSNNFVKNNTYLYYGLYDTNQNINLASDYSTDSNNNFLRNNTFSTTALNPVISKNSTAINLTWNAPSLDNSPPILYYEVYRSITYFSPFEYNYPIKLVANTTSFSFVDTDFTNNTQNNYFILSVNSIDVTTEIQISIGIGRNITTTPMSIYSSTKTIPSFDIFILFSTLLGLVFIQKQKRK